MSLLAPPEELFSWLEQNGVTYVVLRDGHRVNRERLEDIDLLVDDAAIDGLKTAFRKRRRGLKVDCYGVKGLYGSDYHGFPHLPEPLGERILRHRQKMDRVWLPQPIDELNALLYHVVYHKNLQSGFHAFEPDLANPAPTVHELSSYRPIAEWPCRPLTSAFTPICRPWDWRWTKSVLSPISSTTSVTAENPSFMPACKTSIRESSIFL